MPNTRDLRRKIRSVKNTMQLTRAMKMVSAAKLRRAQEAMQAARPYAAAMRHMLPEVARRSHPELHPLLASRPEKSVELILIGGDKGLCGAFNSQVIKAAVRWLDEQSEAGKTAHLSVVGRKPLEVMRRRKVSIREGLSDATRSISYVQIRDVAQRIEQRFIDGESGGVYICFNEFRSAASQKPVIRQVLPLHLAAAAPRPADSTDYIYEPDAESLLAALLPKYVAFQLFQATLESVAAEHAARMAAMDNATRNAKEMIEKLTLLMNRVRQAAITKEIIEVVSGAEALG